MRWIRSVRPTPRLLIVTNVGWFFLSHRLPLAQKARASGFEVHVATGIEDPAEESRIRALAFHFHRLSLSRGGMNPVAEIRVMSELVRLYRRVRPTLIHHVSLKSVLYGGIAARIAGIRRTVNSFTGMGYLFSATGWFPRFVRSFLWMGLRLCLGGNLRRAIVQNQEDLRSLVSRGVITRDRIDLIRGSGVDLGMFGFQPLPSGIPVVLLVARMLADKGVVEFLDAAELLLARGVRARFVLAGEVDLQNPASLTKEYLAARQRGSDIEWLGHCRDVVALMRDSTIVCLRPITKGCRRRSSRRQLPADRWLPPTSPAAERWSWTASLAFSFQRARFCPWRMPSNL